MSYAGNTLSYDAANHWTSGTINRQSVGFGYDGLGRRVSRTFNDGRTSAAGHCATTAAIGSQIERCDDARGSPTTFVPCATAA